MEWGLTMTQRETEAVIEMLDTCGELIEVEAKRAGGIAGTGTSGRATEGGGNGNADFSTGTGTAREHLSIWVLRGSGRSWGVKGAGGERVPEGNGPQRQRWGRGWYCV